MKIHWLEFESQQIFQWEVNCKLLMMWMSSLEHITVENSLFVGVSNWRANAFPVWNFWLKTVCWVKGQNPCLKSLAFVIKWIRLDNHKHLLQSKTILIYLFQKTALKSYCAYKVLLHTRGISEFVYRSNIWVSSALGLSPEYETLKKEKVIINLNLSNCQRLQNIGRTHFTEIMIDPSLSFSYCK